MNESSVVVALFEFFSFFFNFSCRVERLAVVIFSSERNLTILLVERSLRVSCLVYKYFSFWDILFICKEAIFIYEFNLELRFFLELVFSVNKRIFNILDDAFNEFILFLMCSRNEFIFVLVSDFMLVGKNFFNSDRKSFSKNIQ